MSARISLWLTDEEEELLRKEADSMGIRHFELAILRVVSSLGVDMGKDTPKGRRKWLQAHEQATRASFKKDGGGTERKLEAILRDSDGPMSTPELRDGLGWKSSGSLSSILNGSKKFQSVDAPAGVERRRGRQPQYWVMAERKAEKKGKDKGGKGKGKGGKGAN